jgi:hypothetical protein
MMWRSCVRICLGVVFLSIHVRAQDMAAVMELMQPGPEHERLKLFEGEWDMSTRMWMPGQPEIKTDGTSTNRLILGGRFLEMRAVSKMVGANWESLTILGFDRRHDVFTFVGYDTWGTYYVTASGTYVEEKKKLILSGEDTDPVMGMKQKYSFIYTWTNEDTFTIELVFIDFPGVEQKEYRMIEITYRRKQERASGNERITPDPGNAD